MCHKTKYDIHFCTDDEKTVAYELAAMEDFEAIHPDSQINRHQDIKNWETFYYAASRLIDESKSKLCHIIRSDSYFGS